MIIVDGHQDLAWNIQSFGRDYTLSASATRQREALSDVPALNGDTLLGWPEYRRGQVALIFASLFASPEKARVGAWESQVYATPQQARHLYRSQLDTYHRLADQHPSHFRLVLSRKDMHEVVEKWRQAGPLPQAEGGSSDPPGQDGNGRRPSRSKLEPERLTPAGPAASQDPEEQEKPDLPVGLVPLMEGAEAISDPGELEEWWQRGLRLVGPAWLGNRFCGGTRQPGPLTSEGHVLLEAMSGIGFGLDLSHMDEQAVLQALDSYPGTIVASHSNALALLKGIESNRFLSDQVIQGLIERGGVIGVVPLNGFLLPGWKASDSRQEVSLQRVAAHIDYICQMAGSARHVGLGTDFDGGYGLQSVPAEVDTIADLRKLIPMLADMGYSEADITAVMGQNWIDVLSSILPEA
jgi:membrane dipeptidase